MKPFKIEVQQQDILKGARQDCNLCPVARAIARKFPDAGIVGVTPGRAHLRFRLPDETIFFSAKLPRSATRFIRAFDEGIKHVVPFNFMLNLQHENNYGA